jgi:hypothetical protein
VEEIQSKKLKNLVKPLSGPTEFLVVIKLEERTPKKQER